MSAFGEIRPIADIAQRLGACMFLAMSNQKPNREGWMTGVLADAPTCPPFPNFTDFERLVLESIAPLFGAKAGVFREQVACAEVIDRINTNVGFYTRVKVDRTKCSPVLIFKSGGTFEVEGIEHGLDIILWDTDGDGYLETIEAVSVDEDPLKGVELADLKFIRLAQLG